MVLKILTASGARSALLAVGLFLVLQPVPVGAESDRWLLAGGHLPACSSYAESACVETIVWPDDAFHQRRFQADSHAVARWRTAMHDEIASTTIDSVVAIVESIAERRTQALSASDFTHSFRRTRIESEDPDQVIDGESVYDAMPDRPWDALLDHLEQAPVTDEGEPLSEYVALDDSESAAARSIYRRLVEMASSEASDRPTVLVSTAASRNPYEALDYYSGVLRQAGAEVVWLPLDAALQAAREAGECDRLEYWQGRVLGVFDRARVSPRRFELQQRYCRSPEAGPALLDRADALFLNGGDQSLTRAAFLDQAGRATPELAALRERLRRGGFVLGGTSAGTAVQSTQVMISNGSTAAALQAGAIESAPPERGCSRDESCNPGVGENRLTFSRGGIGTFPVGVLDTHFTERRRHLRLLQLLAQTGQRFGIGVDETTALEAVRMGDDGILNMTVHGRGFAWILDLGASEIDSEQPLELSNARLTRVAAGGRVRFSLESGVDFERATPSSDVPRQPVDCRAVDDDKHFVALLSAPPHRAVCLDLDIDGRVFRMILEPFGMTDAVADYRVSGRFLPNKQQ